VSSVSQPLQTFPDVFIRLYDELDDLVAREHGEQWIEDHLLRSLAVRCAEDIVAQRTTPQRAALDVVGSSDAARLYARLRGIDLALRHVNPALRGVERTPAGLLRVEQQLALRGRLDSGEHGHGGALLPRVVPPPEVESAPIDDKRDLFTYVQRVPQSSWEQAELVTIGASRRMNRFELVGGIDIACVPVIADPDELVFVTRDTAHRRYTTSAPATCPPRSSVSTRSSLPPTVKASSSWSLQRRP
jgi:hypothetical protein